MKTILKEVVQNHVNQQEGVLRRIVDDLHTNKEHKDEDKDTAEKISLSSYSSRAACDSLAKVKKGTVLFENQCVKVKINDKASQYSRTTKDVTGMVAELIMLDKRTKEALPISLRLDLEEQSIVVSSRGEQEDESNKLVARLFTRPYLESLEREERGGTNGWRGEDRSSSNSWRGEDRSSSNSWRGDDRSSSNGRRGEERISSNSRRGEERGVPLTISAERERPRLMLAPR